MNRMLDRLEDSDSSHRTFFSDASHELRSPLSTLVTTAEVASLDKSGKTWLDMQYTVLNELSRMQSLVEDLLTLAKVDAHQLQLEVQDVDLEDILDSEIKRLRTSRICRSRPSCNPCGCRVTSGGSLRCFGTFSTTLRGTRSQRSLSGWSVVPALR